MATVLEIVDRLAKEDPLYGIYRPGLGVQDTHVFEAIPTEGDQMSWLPNRKVVTGMVAGAVSAIAIQLTGAELGPELAAAATTVAMAVVSYLVPLKNEG